MKMSNGKDSRRSWVIALGTFLLMLLETGTIKSLGVLLPSIREQFATMTWVVGFAIALVPGFGAVICLSSGAITKLLSPRTTITLCGLLSAVGLMCASMATDVYVLMVSFILTGFSTGTSTVSVGALSKYFDKHYNIAVTSASCGVSMGIIIMPLLSQMFLDKYGWRGAALLLSAICMNTVICGLLFKPPEAGNRRQHEYKLLQSSINTGIAAKLETAWYRDVIVTLDLHLFTNVHFVALVVMSIGFGYSLTGWMIYLVPHALDVGFSPYAASAIATAGGVGSLVGNCVYPMLYRFMPNKPILYISILLSSIALVLDTVVTSMWSSYVGMAACSVLYGLTKGVASTAWYTECNDVIDDDKKIISAIGWAYTAHGVASIITGFTTGWLFDVYGSFAESFLVLGAVAAASLIPQCILDVLRLSSREAAADDMLKFATFR